MAEGQNIDNQPVTTPSQLKESQYGKHEAFQKSKDRIYAAEFRGGKGGAIMTMTGRGRAWIGQTLGFDEGGTLSLVRVEKRLLKRPPQNEEEANNLFAAQVHAGRESLPSYQITLQKDKDGKFLLVDHKTTDTLND